MLKTFFFCILTLLIIATVLFLFITENSLDFPYKNKIKNNIEFKSKSNNKIQEKHDEGVIQENKKNYEKNGRNLGQKNLEQKNTIAANEEFLLGNNFYLKKEYEKAILKYKNSILLDPTVYYYYSNLGNCLRENREYEESVLVLQKSVFLSDKNSKSWYNLGVTYQTMGSYEQAVGAYVRATDLDDENINAHYNKGNNLNIY